MVEDMVSLWIFLTNLLTETLEKRAKIDGWDSRGSEQLYDSGLIT